jgi:hypothetical protein
VIGGSTKVLISIECVIDMLLLVVKPYIVAGELSSKQALTDNWWQFFLLLSYQTAL